MYNFTFRSNVYKANIFSPNIGIQDNQSTDIILSMLTLTNVSKKKLLLVCIVNYLIKKISMYIVPVFKQAIRFQYVSTQINNLLFKYIINNLYLLLFNFENLPVNKKKNYNNFK